MNEAFHVGDWLVEPDLNSVSRHGTIVHLQPKVMKVLVRLAQQTGEVVSKEALFESVWPDTFVTDDVLKRSISELRRVFEDDAQESHIIQTIPKRGYRLIVPISPVKGTKAVSPSLQELQSQQTVRKRPALGMFGGLALLLLVTVGVYVAYSVRNRATAHIASPAIHAIAVLPLENLSADPAQEYFSEGMTDGLITDLAQIGSLKVISRTSSMQYKQTKKTLPEIARELGVDAVVEGTVQRSGDRVRITAQFIEASTDKHLWANTYERDVGDMLALEREVAGDIASQVAVHVKAHDQGSSAQSRVVDSRALDEYLQGNYHLRRFSRGSGDEELKLASDHFQRAIDVDRNFALAYVGVAMAHSTTMKAGNDEVKIATEATEKAIQLDPTLSDAWGMLGDIKASSWHWVEAEEDLNRAIALNPNNADAHETLADLLDILGRVDEGWKEYQIAQQLDPNADLLFYAFYKRHEYDRVIQSVTRMLDHDPDNGYLNHNLYEAYAAKGMHKEAIEQLQKVVTLFGFPRRAKELRRAYAASGYGGAMREYASLLEHLHRTGQAFMPVNVAAAYAAIGEKDRAFYWLEQGFEQRGSRTAGIDFREVGVYRGLDPLRADPRFTDLLRRMGLPEVKVDDPARARDNMRAGSVDQ